MCNWKPTKTQKVEYATKMREIERFCSEKGIQASYSKDSYYFTLNGKNYRISNHSVEKSNEKAYNAFGEKVREEYHPKGREDNTVYIHASKTRLIEIYNDLVAGYKLNGRGRRI